mmetsp:Transcript_84803/g.243394  ORF Transcript_84803/g.243394 Transcript_84803/m.243394 type:complete len:264 (-) Transcript_84803:985-1776(-)|eukprot:CAMPEP_0177164444 /NCGR_PEP_ID=MMETSP0367-20130122/6950_1 /TAXON_ID=447022 ORGANISM="Scrippsiella hangoei-like, Strain SHHI-4" /NCGR_SAMPLE_ID=MMETSP0367 /ASSEMBLY_ACC=CAM_ASM_000362 /LENGTH=263 /DNA_ID=CAMNT_0018610339 /DNA_START=132 /DNA_END=923 /DNA_ORIENTATION=-
MHVASRAARGRADAGCWHQHWRSCNELCHGARKHIKSSTAEGRCLLRSFFALVQVQDLENVALAQRFPVSGQLGPFSRNGLEMIASGVVHDAAKIVRSKSNEGVADAVVLGSDIGVGVRLVLVQPTLLLDVVPMDNEVRALAMVLLHRVGALLLVIHAQDMAELVDEVPDIALGVTPSHVHRRPDGVARVADVADVAMVCVLRVHLKAWCRSWLRGLHEVDAGLFTPCCYCLAKGGPSSTVQGRVEVIFDDNVLLPSPLQSSD